MTASQVIDAFAEIDFLEQDSRFQLWKKAENDRRIAKIREQLARSRDYAIHLTAEHILVKES